MFGKSGSGENPAAQNRDAAQRVGAGAGVAADAPRWEGAHYENKQLVHRHPVEFVRRVLIAFNSGALFGGGPRQGPLCPSRALTGAPARVYRRFRRARIGGLWQHDTSIHQWWPPPSKQTLLLTVDDHSGLNLAGRFVESDTTWNRFEHVREAFEIWGLPEIIYTDGLSLFGPSSSHDHSDPKSEFQRALRGFGVAHLAPPTPQAKGKIERRFGTFQRRLVTLLAHARAQTWRQSNDVLQMEIARQNRTVNRTLGKVPLAIWETQSQLGEGRMRPTPPAALLDLHLSLRCSRRVHHDHTIDFDGHDYEIAPTLRKNITLVHHPCRPFWIIEHPPKDIWPSILGHFTL